MSMLRRNCPYKMCKDWEILERGANVNVKNVKNETALIKAVVNGYDKTVALLLNNHASVREAFKKSLQKTYGIFHM